MNKNQELILEFAKEIYIADLLAYYNFNNKNKKDYKLVCFGDSDISRKLISLFPFLKIDLIVDNDFKKSTENSNIFHPSILKTLKSSQTIIFNCTSNPCAVKKQLFDLDFTETKHNINASLILHSPFLIRIYLEKNIEFLQNFSKNLNYIKSKYIFADNLGIYEDRKFPNCINSIITDNNGFLHLSNYVNTFNLLEHNNNKIPLDIIVKDLKYPNFAGIYPKQLIKDAYNSKYKINPLGIKVLQNKYKEIVFYYKSLFFPKSLVIENQESCLIENSSYQNIKLKNLFSERRSIEILNRCKYKIPLDKARNQELHLRLRGIKKTLLQNNLSSRRNHNNKELIVFIIRKCLIDLNLFNNLKMILSKYDLIFLAESFFDDGTKLIMKENIRGGNWDSSELEKRSGPPVGLISYIDTKPTLKRLESLNSHPYRTTEIYNEKSKIRKKLSQAININTSLNFIHSPDDEREAFEYIELLIKEEKRKHLNAFNLY